MYGSISEDPLWVSGSIEDNVSRDRGLETDCKFVDGPETGVPKGRILTSNPSLRGLTFGTRNIDLDFYA